MTEFMDKTFSEALRKRIGNTWASLMACQEGSETVSDGSPASSPEDSPKNARVLSLKGYGVKETHKILELGSGGGGLVKTLQQAGFTNVTYRNLTGGVVAIHSGHHG